MLHRRGRRRIPRVCVLADPGATHGAAVVPLRLERVSAVLVWLRPRGVTVAGPSRILTGVPPRSNLIVPQAGLMDSWTSSFLAARRRLGS